jgi:hypothetical protein
VLTQSWQTYDTGPWTWNSVYGDIALADIYQLQVAVEKGASETSGEACVTQVYATINYTVGIPTLDWVVERGFFSDGVHPDSAPKGSTFEFLVEYEDSDGVPPAVSQVWIDLDDSGTYEEGEKFVMEVVDKGDSKDTEGRAFHCSIPIDRAGDGVLNYRFFFSDGAHDATGDPATDHAFVVTQGDTAPTVQEVDHGTLLEGTSSDPVTSGSPLQFWVHYADEDNDPPQVSQVWVDLDDSGSYELEEKFDMENLGGADYQSGVDYMKSITMYHPGEPSDGVLRYRFHFSDGLYVAESDFLEGAVTVDQSGGIYYVCKEGKGTPPYDVWAEAAGSIRSAVAQASRRLGRDEVATVIVAQGTYNEPITMKDGVHVINKAGDTPILMGPQEDGQEIVKFSGPMKCNLRGFEIANTGKGAGIFMEGTSGRVTTVIEGCVIHDSSNGAGIRLDGQVWATIAGCSIYGNGEGGISTKPGGMTPDQLESGSSVLIAGNIIGDVGKGNGNAGIYLRGAGPNIQVAVGGPAVGEGNAITCNGEAGIRLQGIDQVRVENNDISHNSEAGMLLVDVSTVSPHISNNRIHHHVNEAGINIGGASKLIVGDGNHVYANQAGIVFYVLSNSRLDGGASSMPVVIKGNSLYENAFAGIAVRDAITGGLRIAENRIFQNKHGGIGIHNTCELEIVRNDIFHNVRGGIHTGTDEGDAGEGLLTSDGLIEVTIRQNKVYTNGQSGEDEHGGGIDVRHASGLVENNLVYGNKRGGIRFGDYIREITNNTVVANGQDDIGGGIIYDDPALGAVNSRADGLLRGIPLIRNNICAFNEKAGLRVGGNGYPCPENPDYGDGGRYWDYNLLYANNGTGENNCRWNSSSPQRGCVNRNFGGCWFACEELDGERYCWISSGPHDMVANPLFVENSENYSLAPDSPALCGGICLGLPCSECQDPTRTDLGAHGGRYPIDW